MRTLAAALVLVFAAAASSQETARTQLPAGASTAPQAAAIEDNVSHLLQAADHLAAAGLADQADKLRKVAEAARLADGKSILARKEAELQALHLEVEQLRKSAGAFPRQIGVSLQIIEVSHTDLQAAGFDVGKGGVGELFNRGRPNAESLAIAALDPGDAFLATVESMRREGRLKVLAEPRIVTASGRPAWFHFGGEFPKLVPAANGAVGVEYHKYGTYMELEPRVQADGSTRLDLRPSVSQIDESRSVTNNRVKFPGLRIQQLEAVKDLKPGQTLAVAGALQTLVRGTAPGHRGRKTRANEAVEEVELLVLAKPDFAGPGAAAQSTDQRATLIRKEAEMEALHDELEQLRAAMHETPRQIEVHLQVMEVSLTKLRASGFPIGKGGFAELLNRKELPEAVAAMGSDESIQAAVEGLRKQGLVKVVAEPTIVTLSGRPTWFNAGGEFPVVTANERGEVSIEYKKHGTQLDLLPRLLADGSIRMGLRTRVSEIDHRFDLKANGVALPSLRVREVDVAVELRPGQSFVVAVQARNETLALDKNVGEKKRAVNEIELLIVATPALVDPTKAATAPTAATSRLEEIPNTAARRKAANANSRGRPRMVK